MNLNIIKPHLKKIKITAIFLFVLGSLDPMEGSILIAFASCVFSFLYYYHQSPVWKSFLLSSSLIIVGVFFLFFLSSLGGFGGNSNLSIWWGLTILPYPVGWLGIVVLLWKYRK